VVFTAMQSESAVAYCGSSSPVTAAGPQRICTVFPILSGQRRAAGTP
jgi:hypothetical protein